MELCVHLDIVAGENIHFIPRHCVVLVNNCVQFPEIAPITYIKTGELIT